jgi:hypothetical protein
LYFSGAYTTTELLKLGIDVGQTTVAALRPPAM